VAELVEAVETIRVRVGAEGADAERLAKVEQLLVGIVILGEALHAEGDGRHAVIGAQLLDGRELLFLGVWRDMSVLELGIGQAEFLRLLQRLLEVELAEGVALHADREASEVTPLPFLLVVRDQARGGAQSNKRGAGLQKITTVLHGWPPRDNDVVAPGHCPGGRAERPVGKRNTACNPSRLHAVSRFRRYFATAKSASISSSVSLSLPSLVSMIRAILVGDTQTR